MNDSSTSVETPEDVESVEFDVVESPETFIVHRYVDSDGKQHEKRMPTSEWADYAKRNNL